MTNNWKQYKGKKVRLLIEDTNFPKPKDGIVVDVDENHIWLLIEGQDLPKPFLIPTIRRVDLHE